MGGRGRELPQRSSAWKDFKKTVHILRNASKYALMADNLGYFALQKGSTSIMHFSEPHLSEKLEKGNIVQNKLSMMTNRTPQSFEVSQMKEKIQEAKTLFNIGTR